MRILVIALLTSLGSAPLASAASLDCTSFLTGQWKGNWSDEWMGQAALVDAVAAYNADGSFEQTMELSPADPAMAGTPPMVISAEGTWKATAGEDDTCLLDLEGTAQMGDMTGATPQDLTIVRVGDDTIRSIGTTVTGEPDEMGELTRVKD